MKISFIPYSITYQEQENRPVVFLYGKTLDGKPITVADKSMQPYFYVELESKKDASSVSEKILSLKEEKKGTQAEVVDIKVITKKIIGQEKELLQVFTNVPKAVPIIRELVKEWDTVKKTYEYDILFIRKYCFDKQITPLTVLDVEGDEEDGIVYASSIQQSKKTDDPEPKIIALDIETYDDNGDVDMDKNPILMIGMVGKSYTKVLTWKDTAKQDKNIVVCNDEKEMLQAFAQEFKKQNPDIITGYFTDGFDFPYIAKRAKKLKVQLPIGRDESELKIKGTAFKESKIEGVAHLDLIKFIRNTIGRTMRTDSYSLDNVAKEILGEQKIEVDIKELSRAWDANDKKKIQEFIDYNIQDCKLTYKLFVSLWPQMQELIRLVSLNPADAIRMTVSQLVEAYVMWHAVKRNEVAPNKPGYQESQARMLNPIKGAFVFEPKPGIYENIAVFDFRSLYPSIIASHNISLETLHHGNPPTGVSAAPMDEPMPVWFDTKEKGFISKLIGDILEKRIDVKKALKKDKDSKILAARSESLKLLANSFYGYLAYYRARWYSRDAAGATTAYARHYIHQVMDEAVKAGFAVLYGDTDSVFLHLKGHTEKEAFVFMEKINDRLPGIMELEFEGTHPTGIFVGMKGGRGGAKKKYALLNPDGTVKIKGFESVRRNWSPISKEVQEEVLKHILKDKDPEAAFAYVQTTIIELQKHKVPIEKVTIRTQLQKNISSYESVGPHVRAAILMKQKGEKVSAGKIIRYVITEGKGRIGDRVKLPADTKQTEYDSDYYITNQVIPAVTSIFEALGVDIEEAKPKKQQSLSSFF